MVVFEQSVIRAAPKSITLTDRESGSPTVSAGLMSQWTAIWGWASALSVRAMIDTAHGSNVTHRHCDCNSRYRQQIAIRGADLAGHLGQLVVWHIVGQRLVRVAARLAEPEQHRQSDVARLSNRCREIDAAAARLLGSTVHRPKIVESALGIWL